MPGSRARHARSASLHLTEAAPRRAGRLAEMRGKQEKTRLAKALGPAPPPPQGAAAASAPAVAGGVDGRPAVREAGRPVCLCADSGRGSLGAPHPGHRLLHSGGGHTASCSSGGRQGPRPRTRGRTAMCWGHPGARKSCAEGRGSPADGGRAATCQGWATPGREEQGEALCAPRGGGGPPERSCRVRRTQVTQTLVNPRGHDHLPSLRPPSEQRSWGPPGTTRVSGAPARQRPWISTDSRHMSCPSVC